MPFRSFVALILAMLFIDYFASGDRQVSMADDVAAADLAKAFSAEEYRLIDTGISVTSDRGQGWSVAVSPGATTENSASNIYPPRRGTLAVHPRVSHFDESVEVFISDLEPGQLARLRVSVTDSNGNRWESVACFQANDQGEINPASQKPLTGSSYSGQHAMGPFWSMVPERLAQFQHAADLMYTITLESEGAVVAREHIWRSVYESAALVEFEKEELRGDIYANFYQSEVGNGKPTIILLGGSGGQFQTQTALYLASKGYAVLDLIYFEQTGLPPRLERVPLEYLDLAVQWVKHRRKADSSVVVLMGRSRGAEYALLYASQFDEVDAVISNVGSNLAWSAKSYFRSSWTLENNEIPFARGSLRQALGFLWKSRGVGHDQLSYFESALKKSDKTEGARIKVEHINAPILLLSGKSDMQWPSTEMSERLVAQAAQADFPHHIKHVAYDDAGHEFLALPHSPQPDFSDVMTWASGGTPQGNALAAIGAWAEIFGFLEEIQDDRLNHADQELQ